MHSPSSSCLLDVATSPQSLHAALAIGSRDPIASCSRGSVRTSSRQSVGLSVRRSECGNQWVGPATVRCRKRRDAAVAASRRVLCVSRTQVTTSVLSYFTPDAARKLQLAIIRSHKGETIRQASDSNVSLKHNCMDSN